jgi:hypothetical protein
VLSPWALCDNNCSVGPRIDDLPNLFALLLAILFLAFLLVLIAVAIRIVANDARSRGKSPLLVVLLCLLSFPLGRIVWLIFRPEPMTRYAQ